MRASDTDETQTSFTTGSDAETGALERAREWLLIDGDRLFLALCLSAATFLLFLTLAHLGVISFVNDDSITRLAGGMIAGTFSLVTLVVSINQLILSREFSSAGEARERLGGVLEFRHDVGTAAEDSVPPAAPTGLLEVLAETIHRRAAAVGDAVDADAEGPPDESANVPTAEVRDRIRAYATRVEERTDALDETFEGTQFGTFEAVSATLAYDDAWQLYAARQFRTRHEDTLGQATLEALDELIEVLEFFAVAREHFKTTYLQRELTRFSQLTIYTGLPAILAAMLIGLVYADFGGAAISLVYLPVVVSALIAVVVSPLALLVSYILRTATVTRRTASVGPMLPQKDPDEGPFEQRSEIE
ncbi:hypothetical protein [Natronobiforma cellulositropha]|uniref:hypothetical protein n=1 Tax=Natronobiforma cellulositropha TaxID=1679076 RepID=UPI0021D5C7FC|nr:hypothetical protein [Natronobiforma cellulositropha]